MHDEVGLVNRLSRANEPEIDGGWLDASQGEDLLSVTCIKPKAH